MAEARLGCVGGKALGMEATVSQRIWICLGVWSFVISVMRVVVEWGFSRTRARR